MGQAYAIGGVIIALIIGGIVQAGGPKILFYSFVNPYDSEKKEEDGSED